MAFNARCRPAQAAARPQDVLLFNNSRTGGKEVACNLTVRRVANVMAALEDGECRPAEVRGGRDPQGSQGGPCPSQWVTVATGANYPAFPLVGPVLEELVARHLQFQVGGGASSS